MPVPNTFQEHTHFSKWIPSILLDPLPLFDKYFWERQRLSTVRCMCKLSLDLFFPFPVVVSIETNIYNWIKYRKFQTTKWNGTSSDPVKKEFPPDLMANWQFTCTNNCNSIICEPKIVPSLIYNGKILNFNFSKEVL